MKEKVGFIMVLLTQAAMASTVVQRQNTTIEGKVGDTVILPCSTEDKTDISHDLVEWLVKDPTDGDYKDVHVYHQGEDQLHNQRDDFKGRTSLFKEELSSGNCSLSLLVTTSHSGKYYCFVPGLFYCTVTLKVLPEGKDNSSQMNQEVTVSPVNPLILPAGNNNPCPDLDNPDMVQHPNTTIEGKVGDTVILPCSTKDKTDISHDQVEWLVKDPTDGDYKDVHLYYQGEDQLFKQRDDFKDRTSLFKEELSSGNCSLSLLVNTSHDDTYYCCVAAHLYCTVTLKVLPENNPSHDPGNRKSGSGGEREVVLGVGGVVLLLLTGIITYFCY